MIKSVHLQLTNSIKIIKHKYEIFNMFLLGNLNISHLIHSRMMLLGISLLVSSYDNNQSLFHFYCCIIFVKFITT